MSAVIQCQVIPAGSVVTGDLLWVPVDGFQKVTTKQELANGVAFILANGIAANRFSDDQALIQARMKPPRVPGRAVPARMGSAITTRSSHQEVAR